MKNKNETLIIGDTHLQDKYPGYLDNQVNSLITIIKNNTADNIVFLGDIFHKRSPSPTELLATDTLFSTLAKYAKERNSTIHVIMGNHDAQFKADDGTTALSLYTKYIKLYTSPTLINTFAFIPHYENESIIIDFLNEINNTKIDWIFGHFGYSGCLNATGNYDFNINPDIISCNSVLGHIHEHRKYTNSLDKEITILGTPYQTDFLGQDVKRYIGLINNNKLKLQEVKIGPKYISCDITTIEDIIKSTTTNQYLIVRLYVDKFVVDNLRDLRKELMAVYPQIAYLDIRFSPELKDKSAQSTYAPKASLASINEMIILDYLKEKASPIPEDELLEGLNIINENKSSQT